MSTLQINKTKYQLAKYFALASFGGIFLLSITSLQPLSFGENANAESQDVDVSVTLEPTISISTNVNSVSMAIAPSDLGSVVTSDTVTVNVGTNNPSGYTLSIASSNTNPALLKDGTSTTYTIPTLSSPTTSTTWASDNDLNNKWGFTHNNTDLLPTNTYLGVPASTTSGTTIKSTTSPASSSETNVTFATKIDQTQPAGSYENTVVLSAVANVAPNTYMQDFTASQCKILPIWTPTNNAEYTLIDKRDNSDYKVRRLADGNCWMAQNLRLSAESLAAAGHSTILDSTDTDLPGGTTFAMPASAYTQDNGTSPTWSGWDQLAHTIRPQEAHQNTTNGPVATDSEAYQRGNYYSWTAAVANSNTSSTRTNITKFTSICPKGWKLPTGVGIIEGVGISTTNQFVELYAAYSGIKSDMDKGLHYYLGNNTASYTGAWWPDTASIHGIGVEVDFWSASSHSTIASNAWALLEDSSNGIRQLHYTTWGYGLSVRCILNS